MKRFFFMLIILFACSLGAEAANLSKDTTQDKIVCLEDFDVEAINDFASKLNLDFTVEDSFEVKYFGSYYIPAMPDSKKYSKVRINVLNKDPPRA